MSQVDFVRRHGAGRVGRPIKVRTNFFEVTALPQGNIIHFDVTITPTVPARLNRRIFDKFVNDNNGNGGPLEGTYPVYDGSKNMFSNKLIPAGNAYTTNVQLEEDGGGVSSRRPPRIFAVKIRRVADINLGELVSFLDGRSRMTDACATAIMALDVLIAHQTSNLYVTVRRSFYTPERSSPLSDGLEVWQGFYQSARPTRGRMLINIDLSATAFYESGPLIKLITNILGLRTPDDLRRGFNDRDRQRVERVIKGLRIRDNHRDRMRRRFKINGLTSTAASHTQFDIDGRRVSVSDYFLNIYNRRLNHAYLPCVIVKSGVFLPVEVCDVVEGQRYMRKLSTEHVNKMAKFTRKPPAMRANSIMEGCRTLNNDYVRRFGMRISNDMEVVNARVLPAPTLQYHPSSTESRFQPNDGTWNLRGKKVATGTILGSWSVLVFGGPRPEIIQAFIRELVNTCQQTGMNIPNKNPPILHKDIQGRVEDHLKEAWLKAGNTAKAQPQLIVCILPNTGTALYAEIKRVSDTMIGVATQCIQSKHTLRPNKQYCANVCLKINVKLGGMNSFLSPSDIPFITEKPTIIFGADMTHPEPSKRNRPSIAALCASMDAKASRYAATIRIQSGRSDIIADLANMVKDLLKTFYQTCGRKPERVLFYRDGISEGQFAHVLRAEVSAVRAACQALDVNYKPTITFAVVQKRHHARFFPMSRQEADRSGNCQPGTVVDTGITHPFEFDYYLQSHAGLLGTSRPAHYHILFDENGFDADAHQTLSYNLCYLYARCTRAVSLVPPVYYADLVCTRARFHSPEIDWSDTETSEEGEGAPTHFGVVKEDLQRVMYYM